MTEPGFTVSLRLPEEWMRIDPGVLADSELLEILALPLTSSLPDATSEDVVAMAVLSEVVEDDDGAQVGALIASLVAVLVPPIPAHGAWPMTERRPVPGLPEDQRAWLHVITYRVALPDLNSDLLLQFSTPNLPLVDELEAVFGRVIDSVRCEPMQDG